jgi:hypothetical protein
MDDISYLVDLVQKLFLVVMLFSSQFFDFLIFITDDVFKLFDLVRHPILNLLTVFLHSLIAFYQLFYLCLKFVFVLKMLSQS